jgi:hypothetical protein
VASQLGDGPAFVFRNRHHARHVLTWADLYTLAGRFAAVLRDGSFAANDPDAKKEQVWEHLSNIIIHASTRT